jgi:hypothetical protein
MAFIFDERVKPFRIKDRSYSQAEVERQASYTEEDWPAGGSGRRKQSYGSFVEDFFNESSFLDFMA